MMNVLSVFAMNRMEEIFPTILPLVPVLDRWESE